MTGPRYVSFGGPYRVRAWLGAGSWVVICGGGDRPARGWRS